jgi:preprotein translocase subunit SecG
MGFLIGLLTVVMVLDCLALMFLVLIQLPKKDAGAGLAFGGGATDALFGAGSGNVLTKITKYAAAIFFILAIGLSVLQRTYHTRTTSTFEQGLKQASPAPGLPAAPAPAPTGPATTPQPPATKPAATPGAGGLTVTPVPAEDAAPPVAVPATPPTPAAPASTNK